MFELISFFKKFFSYFLFAILLSISTYLLYLNNSYQRVKIYNFSQELTGSLFSANNAWLKYFNLNEKNAQLAEQNKMLISNKLNSENKNSTVLETDQNNLPIDFTAFESYKIRVSEIIRNSFYKPQNYLTINKGSKHGIKQDMAVVTENGIVGIVVNVSKNYSLVMSILHKNFRLSSMHKKSNYKGTITWNVKNPEFVQLADIPKFVEIKKEDIITTSGFSTIFPPNYPIGKVEDFKISKTSNNYEVDVKLNSDLRKLSHVYVLEFKAKEEIDSLNQLIVE